MLGRVVNQGREAKVDGSDLVDTVDGVETQFI